MSEHNFVVRGLKFTNFFVQRRRIVVYNAVYRLSMFVSVSKILALKLKSCSKSRRILDVFCFPKFLGGDAPKKLYTD